MANRILKQNKWLRWLGNKYVLILLLFLAWMFFFDANNWFFHKELNDDIEALEQNEAFYKNEIAKDKAFMEKMKDSTEMEQFARQKYFLKKQNEDIFIIENEDSIQ
ncbi:FtsB family cell division protein [Patiriisocius sp. Uisw_017]|jgi:cell division protein FtsB|uniref:FtsB family cell division protein n=1 Tax=Patiriisocius sp. Uisw_017 TaxID=3230968 RepID=UPI0039E8EF3E